MVKNPPDSEGDAGDVGLLPGSGRFTGGGNGNPLQYACLGNPMDTGAWQTAAHSITESDMTEHSDNEKVIHTINTAVCNR